MILLAAPLGAHAQAVLFTGSLDCPAIAQSVAGGASPIFITQHGYKASYQLLVNGGGALPKGLQDTGRGQLTGLDLTMAGGGTASGISLATNIAATRAGHFYKIKATQVFSGQGLAAPVTRICSGNANLPY